MELFYSGGGNNRPTFSYRFSVKEVTQEMFDWCSNYKDDGRPFRRWHVIWNQNPTREVKECPLIQFEWEEPAIMFALKFGEYIK